MKTTLSVFLFFLLSFKSFAIIGETAEQSDLRYGTPETVRDTPNDPLATQVRKYQKSGINIIVQIFNGITDCIIYAKNDVDGDGRGSELSEDEISQLLNSNSTGKPWGGVALGDPSTLEVKTYYCKNLALSAQYSRKLLIINDESWDFRKDPNKKKTTSLNGL
jgi:hypothetical protein